MRAWHGPSCCPLLASFLEDTNGAKADKGTHAQREEGDASKLFFLLLESSSLLLSVSSTLEKELVLLAPDRGRG